MIAISREFLGFPVRNVILLKCNSYSSCPLSVECNQHQAYIKERKYLGRNYFMMAVKDGSYSLKLEQVQLKSMLRPLGGIRKEQRIA